MLAWNSRGRQSRREGIGLGATLRLMVIEDPALESDELKESRILHSNVYRARQVGGGAGLIEVDVN